jgi:hypothetical protein
MTPAAPLFAGKFTDDDLSDDGNEFARDCFVFETGQYLKDYDQTLAVGLPGLCYVADSWENIDRIKPGLDQRFLEWKAKTENE